MYDQEIIKGKLVNLNLDKENLQDFLRKCLKEKNIDINDMDYSDLLCEFVDNFYEEYIFIDDDLYKIENVIKKNSDFIFDISYDEDRNINFLVPINDNSRSLKESIETAIENLEIKNSKVIFEGNYSGESLTDLSEDIYNCINDIDIPKDEHRFTKGNFKVKIIWEYK